MTDRVTHWVLLIAMASAFILFVSLVGITAVLAYLTWGAH